MPTRLELVPFLAVCVALMSPVACGPDRGRGGGAVTGNGDGGDGGGRDPDDGGEGEGEGGDGGPPPVDPPPEPGDACDLDGAVEGCGGSVGGACRPGWRRCEAGAWGACESYIAPSAEECDGIDNDCDGVVDGTDFGCEPFESGDPDADDGQQQALERINQLRTALGVPLLVFNPALNRAAQNHADYFQDNLPASRRDGHGENRDRDGYTGRHPGERAASAGYEGPPRIMEDMAFGAGPVGSVMMWYDSVFHRIPIVQADVALAGFGHRSDVEVLDVAAVGGFQSARVLTPYDGQENVPRSFNSDFEGPDPVPDDGVVGYPVSLVTSTNSVRPVADGASITPDGEEPYELWIASADVPTEGFLHGSIFLMSKDGMKADTWHTVALEYTVGGNREKKVWRFKTGRR